MAGILAPGAKAPNFKLRVTPDQYLALGELTGKPIILPFIRRTGVPVCGDQMTLYNEVLPEFRRLGAELLGISVDGVWCHEAFAKDRRLHFPLLSDFEPKGAVAKQYGAYREGEGVCERALFVIDREGAIFWSHLSPIAVNPGADGILDALETLPKSGDHHEQTENSRQRRLTTSRDPRTRRSRSSNMATMNVPIARSLFRTSSGCRSDWPRSSGSFSDTFR